jgi:hypothetical protein
MNISRQSLSARLKRIHAVELRQERGIYAASADQLQVASDSVESTIPCEF